MLRAMREYNITATMDKGEKLLIHSGVDGVPKSE
jgi:hypothetical protein